MKKVSFLLLLILLVPAFCFAQNVGRCGWGSKVFHGETGAPAQVMAVTTNGTSGSQTFGISSGTSGCTQGGVVQSNWKTAAFIDANIDKLALDIARGEGESLDSLAMLLGVDGKHKNNFSATLKQNFDSIFPSENVSSQEVAVSLRGVLEANPELAGYSRNI